MAYNSNFFVNFKFTLDGDFGFFAAVFFAFFTTFPAAAFFGDFAFFGGLGFAGVTKFK